MLDILVLILTALVFGFMWAVVIVGMNWMWKTSKMSEDQQKQLFDLHIRA